MNRLLFILSVSSMVIFSGCLAPAPPPPTISADLTEIDRFIIITRDGQSRWTQRMIDDRIAVQDPTYAAARIRHRLVAIERREQRDWFQPVDAAALDPLRLESQQRSLQAGEVIYWCLDRCFEVMLTNPDGTTMSFRPGGIAWRPPGHGLILFADSYRSVAAHEGGHFLDLGHVWDDRLADTPSRGPDDCAADPCNVMSYCDSRCAGSARSLSPQQIAAVRAAATGPRREVFAELRSKMAPSKSSIAARAILIPGKMEFSR